MVIISRPHGERGEEILNEGTKTNFTLAEFLERMAGCGGHVLTVGEIANLLGKKSSQYLGDSWHKKGSKWQVNHCLNGIIHYIGLYSDEVKAANAYDAKMVEIYGAKAKINFPIALELLKPQDDLSES